MIPGEHDMEWSRMKSGDPNALEAIYRAHVKSLVRYGLKLTHDLDLIKDSIQDLFLEIWRNRENLADTTHPKFYLFRALRNKLSKAHARHSFISENELRLAADNLLDEYVELTITTRETEAENRQTLKQLLHKLPRRQQEAVYLRFYHNISYERMAELMSMNYQSVLNLMQRALKALRKEYTPRSSKD